MFNVARNYITFRARFGASKQHAWDRFPLVEGNQSS